METAEIDSVFAVCSDTPPFNYTYSSSSTIGGDWSGPGITDALLGTFDASSAGSGIHVIKYTTPGVCSVSDSVQIVAVSYTHLRAHET